MNWTHHKKKLQNSKGFEKTGGLVKKKNNIKHKQEFLKRETVSGKKKIEKYLWSEKYVNSNTDRIFNLLNYQNLKSDNMKNWQHYKWTELFTHFK